MLERRQCRWIKVSRQIGGADAHLVNHDQRLAIIGKRKGNNVGPAQLAHAKVNQKDRLGGSTPLDQTVGSFQRDQTLGWTTLARTAVAHFA